LDREPADDLRAVARVDTFRVACEVDRRGRDQLVFEDGRKVLLRPFDTHAWKLRFLAAVSDFLRHPSAAADG
jgi:hypothetical protein